jgi:hypothetical protein
MSCVQVERPAGTPGAGTSPTLRATDWRGELADGNDLPRRPRLTLLNDAGFAPIADAILLLRGAADTDLVKDLERAPLLAVHRERVIDVKLVLSPDGATLVPDATLDADTSYTLAVAGWAQTVHGVRIHEDESPVLFGLHTAADAGGGARVVASWPADGASGVGTNLDAVVVAFDGIVQHGEQGVWLQGPDGLAVPAHVAAGECAAIAPEQAYAYCVRLQADPRLAPNALYTLVVGAAAVDAHGAPVGPWRAQFRTASGGDPNPPQLVAQTCAIDEQSVPWIDPAMHGSAPVAPGCALIDDASISVRLQADEAVAIKLRAGDREATALAPAGSALLRLTGFAPDMAVALELELTDSSDNRALLRADVRMAPPLATLTISEVLADPLGPEPQQEFVELWNYGERALDLGGFSLGDRTDTAGETLPALGVEGHARVVLVADAFDAGETRDVPPLPGATLVRVGKTLATSGLANGGEPLYLRDALGRRVSAAPATPRPRAGVCNVRVSSDMRDGQDGSFDYAGSEGCTPGR